MASGDVSTPSCPNVFPSVVVAAEKTLPEADKRSKWSSPAAIEVVFSGSFKGVYDTSDVDDQNGIQVDSVGFGPLARDALDAGKTYTLPVLERQITLSPLKSGKELKERPYFDICYVFACECQFRNKCM